MIRLGLVGYPLDHSLSPKIHDAALQACGLQGSYSLFPIEAGDVQGLNDLMARVRSAEITGINVTSPHKQDVIQFLDELMPVASAVGSVNTICLRDNKLIGDNTDVPGFLSDLKRFLGAETQRPGDSNALVLGAGGSARAVVHALIHDGWNVTITARRIQQAQQLVDSFAASALGIQGYADTNVDLSHIALIVNTTPVGMSPNIDQSPWPQGWPLPARAAVYDLVYNPRETKLVQDARAAGLSATAGLGMLIEQAALAFEIWTGENVLRRILFDAVEWTPAVL